jgi:hypothetical protein
MFAYQEMRKLKFDLDVIKLTVDVTRIGLSGHRIESIFEKNISSLYMPIYLI